MIFSLFQNQMYIYSRILACICISFSCFAYGQSRTLVFCSEASPRYFNPQLATDGTSLTALKDVYDSLLNLDDKDPSRILPSLAQSWRVSKDGLKYTFKLRKDVSFHQTSFFKPTRYMNADDVLFSFSRVFDKNHPFHKASGGSYQFFEAMGLLGLVKKVSKIDSHTVQFELKKQSSLFLISIAMQFASILSKEFADQLIQNKQSIDTIDRKPVGTGPFILVKYVKDTLIRYTRNKNYFKKRPALDKMIFSITTDPSVRLQKLKRGECHISSYPSPADVSVIRKHKKLKLVTAEVYDLSYLGMNVTHQYLRHKKVRQAIRHSLNRNLYIQAIYQGHAKVADGPMPSNMWGYNKNIRKYDYNIKKAKALMKEAGYPNGFKIDLWTLPVSRPYNPSGKKLGELMQADLSKINIKVKLVTYDWTTYLKKVENGDQALFQLGWLSDNGDPDNFLRALLTCSSIEAGTNSARWCNKKYDRLIEQAAKVLNKNQRKRLYKEAQSIFAEESPWAPIVSTIGYRGIRKNVRGYILPSFSVESFYGVSLK